MKLTDLDPNGTSPGVNDWLGVSYAARIGNSGGDFNSSFAPLQEQVHQFVAGPTDPRAQIEKDWEGYWSATAPGTVLDWAQGTLTRNADGSATYAHDGIDYSFGHNAVLSVVAAHNEHIAEQWLADYGIEAVLIGISLGETS